MDDERIRLREDVSMQIRALQDMTRMAATYDVDISKPAANARQAVQALYMALSGRHQGEQRRRHLPGPHLHLPGHLHPAGSGLRCAGSRPVPRS